MGHGFENVDAFAENRENGKIAWHRLGVAIESGLSAEEAFGRYGLGWGTELGPLSTIMETAEGTMRIPVDGWQAHIRCDTREVLGVVSGGYKPFENADLAKLADSLVGEDAAIKVESLGSLYRGRRVFVLVELPKTIEVTSEDILKQYILLGNGHGGFAALSGYPTSIRVVCANTLRWSERDAFRGFKFRHSGDFESKVAVARQVLGLANRETLNFEKQVRALVGLNWSTKQAKAYMEDVYNECFGAIPDSAEEETKAKLAEKRAKVIDKWVANLEDEKQSMKGIRGTAWAALNAVTQWNDHTRGRTGAGSDVRVHSNLFGVSSEHKRSALKLALAAV